MSVFERLPRNYSMVTDAYEVFMANAIFGIELENYEGVFDVFFRPINNIGYGVMAGLDKVIEYIKSLHFTEEDIEYFKNTNYGFDDEFLNYLRNFKFTGDIYAVPDGTPVFPNEPLITVKAPIMEVMIIETALLAIINGAVWHATAARRMVEATPKDVPIMEFGARRADGFESAIDTSLYSIMVGCKGTSNVMAAQILGLRALGTMAHSFIELFNLEFEAFKRFATKYPNNATLLVDTYDTLKSGVPNAIRTFDYMKEQGLPLDNIGIRIDSGDLAYLTKQARKMLDEAGYPNAKICISNSLTAEKIESLIREGAYFNSLGIGEHMSNPNGNLGAVYKLMAVIINEKISPRIKLSNDVIKTTNPDYKDLYRAFDKDTGMALADIICSRGKKLDEGRIEIVSLTDSTKSDYLENYNLVKLQKTIFKDGECVYEYPGILENIAYCEEQMQTIPREVKRTVDPYQYYVDGTREYAKLKNEMILSHRRSVNERY